MSIFNFGIPGASVGEIIQEELPSALAERPALAIVLAGTNDMVNSAKLATVDCFEAQLEFLVAELKRNAVGQVILLTVPPCVEAAVLTRHDPAAYGETLPLARIAAANQAIRRVAGRTGAALCDFHALIAGGNLKKLLSGDGVHPTAKAYKLLAAELFALIRRDRLAADPIVCLGDSITYGWNVDGAGSVSGASYPGQLAQLLTQHENEDE